MELGEHIYDIAQRCGLPVHLVEDHHEALCSVYKTAYTHGVEVMRSKSLEIAQEMKEKVKALTEESFDAAFLEGMTRGMDVMKNVSIQICVKHAGEEARMCIPIIEKLDSSAIVSEVKRDYLTKEKK